MTGLRDRLLNTLSGRFLLLTVGFVMLAEVLIFVPSIARFRVDFLMLRLEKAQIASLSQIAAADMVTPELEAELLANAEVYNVVLRRDDARQLVLTSDLPGPVAASYDLRMAGTWAFIRDALACLLDPGDRVIRVIGEPLRMGGDMIEITMDEGDLRAALVDYGLRILGLSALISAITAVLLFWAVQRLMVAPIQRVARHMQAYAEAPEDARRVIRPNSGLIEMRQTEEAMASMQNQLTSALRQKEHLAKLGQAVAKISHDLRNMLTTAQLFADRLEVSLDPAVARAAPKLVGSLTRAIDLCEATLRFGRAEEPAPRLGPVPLAALVTELADGEGLSGDGPIRLETDLPHAMTLTADSEQIYRVLSNLIRNAAQAIQTSGKPGLIRVTGSETLVASIVRISDTGPGLPAKAQDHLFEAFRGGARKGGTGLGLAIAAELVRGHGGHLVLKSTGPTGTTFEIRLARGAAALAGLSPLAPELALANPVTEG